MDSLAASMLRWRIQAASGLLLLLAGCNGAGPPIAKTIAIESLDSASPYARFEIDSPAGLVVIAGASGDSVAVVLEARKQVRADTLESARRGLLAFQVKIEEDASRGVLAVRPRWEGDPEASWKGEADLTASIPRAMSVAVRAASRVSIAGVAGNVQAETADGEMHVESLGGELTCRTRDGDVHAIASGDHCRIETRGGDVHLKLAGQGEVQIASESGDLFIELSPDCSLTVDLAAAGGVRRLGARVADFHATSTSLTGRIGDGDGRLEARSASGTITLSSQPPRQTTP